MDCSNCESSREREREREKEKERDLERKRERERMRDCYGKCANDISYVREM